MSDFKDLWRDRCLANKEIREIVGDRCYPRHVSREEGAEFPALSLFCHTRRRADTGLVLGQYQIDSWSRKEEEAERLQNLLEDVWHPRGLEKLPEGRGVVVRFIRQDGRTDGAYEPDSKLYHKLSIWTVIWEEI